MSDDAKLKWEGRALWVVCLLGVGMILAHVFGLME